MTLVTLHCQLGDHEWTRESQRGRTPFNCPDHQPETVRTTRTGSQDPSDAPRIGREPTVRIAGIQAILDARGPYCTCRIDATMSDRELMRLPSCQPMWVCPVLDQVRRLYVTYNA